MQKNSIFFSGGYRKILICPIHTSIIVETFAVFICVLNQLLYYYIYSRWITQQFRWKLFRWNCFAYFNFFNKTCVFFLRRTVVYKTFWRYSVFFNLLHHFWLNPFAHLIILYDITTQNLYYHCDYFYHTFFYYLCKNNYYSS